MRIGHLRNGALAALETAGALVDGGQVAVEIAGITFPEGSLAAGAGELSQGLAVIRHVRQDHEDMHPLLKGKVLGQGQGDPRGDEAFDGRGIGQTQEQGGVCEDARFLQGVDEKLRHIEFDAHRRKDDDELFLGGQNPGLPRDLGGNEVVRHAAAGKNRKLLAADQGVHPVNGGDAGLNEVPGVFPAPGIDGQAVDVHHPVRDHLRRAVNRPSQAVEDPAQHVPVHGNLQGPAYKGHPQPLHCQAARPLEDLDDGTLFVHLQRLPHPHRSRGVADFHDLAQSHALHPFNKDQGTGDAGEIGIFYLGAHAGPSSAFLRLQGIQALSSSLFP